jgi:serine/threonine-protein kinase
MPLEPEALLLQRCVRARVIDPDKGTAALFVYSQLKQMGAAFTFGQFLVDQGLLTQMALQAIEGGESVRAVSTIGNYKLIEVLGEGSNGVVFKALQLSLDRVVALKILNADVAADPQALARFQQEARATARISHPNVVAGIDVGSEQGLHYFAMEYVGGGSAKKLLEAHKGLLPEREALLITRQIAEGLRCAHAAGLLHRDIKPDNILLTGDGQAKLADLGISQLLSGKKTEGGDFWCSPPYVAPERVLGRTQDDARCDIYSLGCALFELLAGRPPFIAQTPAATMRMHVQAAAPDIRMFRGDVSPATAKLIQGMLQKDPARRTPGADATAKEIAAILNPPPPPAPSPLPARRPLHVTVRRPAHGKPPLRPAQKKPAGRPSAQGRTPLRRDPKRRPG